MDSDSRRAGEDLSGDGGVLKTVLHSAKDGAQHPSDEFPIADVHYEGKLEETGEVFDSSRVDGAVFSFEVGKGRVIRGWDIAVKTMRVGELAEVRCSAEYAYGNKGAPPEIPPNATLVFEVELVGVRAPKVGGRGADSAHARLEEARRQREGAAAKREEEKKKREEAKAAAEARIKAKLDGKKGGGKGGKSKK